MMTTIPLNKWPTYTADAFNWERTERENVSAQKLIMEDGSEEGRSCEERLWPVEKSWTNVMGWCKAFNEKTIWMIEPIMLLCVWICGVLQFEFSQFHHSRNKTWLKCLCENLVAVVVC